MKNRTVIKIDLSDIESYDFKSKIESAILTGRVKIIIEKLNPCTEENKKQTGVEWLLETLSGSPFLSISNDIKEQALAMDRDRIIAAANQKVFGDITFQGSDEVITKGENYYNQTYKK